MGLDNNGKLENKYKVGPESGAPGSSVPVGNLPVGKDGVGVGISAKAGAKVCAGVNW